MLVAVPLKKTVNCLNVMQTSKYLSQVLPVLLFACLMTVSIPHVKSETQQGANNSVDASGNEESGKLRTVPFLTLRNITGNEKASKFFGGERSDLRAGYCELSHTALTKLKPVAEWAPFHIPEEIVKLDAIRLSPVEEFLSDMESTVNGQSPVLYAHGFFISFERGCKRASLLQQSLGMKGRLVLFSWPSDGSITNYTHDEADLYWSVDPLRGILRDMIDRFGTGKVNVVGHSLGTRGVMLALVRLAKAQQGNEPLVNQVVLIAPDIDVGIFKQYLPVIRPLARNITVYVSSNDSPLALSRQVHGYPRLGEAGEHLQGLTGIEIIDISDIPMRAPSGHVYHLNQNIVVDDLVQLLNENRPAAQRRNLKQSGENQWRLQQAETE